MIDRRMFVAGAAGLAAVPLLAAASPELSVFELRQYTLKGGTRTAFTRLFEQQFVTSQDAVGCHVLAVFRDLDDPDRFVWIRGFADMDARKTALQTFYTGPAWQAHRNEANAMIVDSDNVLLLKRISGPVGPKTLANKGVTRIAIHRLRDVDPAAFAGIGHRPLDGLAYSRAGLPAAARRHRRPDVEDLRALERIEVLEPACHPVAPAPSCMGQA